MPDSLVLRFRDVEAQTVTQHSEIIANRGAVWWAWWRKESEDRQTEVLAAFARRVPLQIGLVNRETMQFFRANCIRIASSDSGDRIATPEPDRTPEYYRSAAFPAWFMLSTIAEIDEDDWNSEFGEAPVGEPTMFVTDPDAFEGRRPYGVISHRPRTVRSTRILHLSDLHFGTDHAFPLTESKIPPLRTPLSTVVSAELARLELGDVGIVVISGDFTTRADGFEAAQSFVEELLHRLDLTPDSLVIVPGNHDIELDEPTATRNYSGERKYRNFARAVTGSSDELNKLTWFRTPGNLDIVVLGLNSVRPRTVATMDYGYVGRDMYEPLLEEVSDIRLHLASQRRPRRLLSVAVLHHHVLPGVQVEEPEGGRPISLTLDAGQLLEDLQRFQFDVVLHGHQHIPFVGSTSRFWQDTNTRQWLTENVLHVIGAGSAGVTRLWSQMPRHTLGVYDAAGDGLQVQMYEFGPNVKLTQWMNIELPLRLQPRSETGT